MTEPTARELTILEWAVRYGYKGAARELGISQSTVRGTLTNIRTKLNARNTADAYRIARDRGLIAA